MQIKAEGFFLSLKGNFTGTFFIALFGSLLFVFRYNTHTDWSIHEWNGVISWATAENLDVSRRIASFYRSFAIFFFSFALLLYLIYQFVTKIFSESELSILNYLSLAGIMLLFFKLIGAEIHQSLMLIFIMQLLVVIYAVADFVLNRFNRRQSLPVHELAWSLIVGASTYFLINYLLLIFNYDSGKYFNIYLLGLSAAALHFCFWLKRKDKSATLSKWIISLKYLALIPVWFVLSQEIYMILNQHNIFSIHPSAIFIALVLVTVLLIVRSNRKVHVAAISEAGAVNVIANFYLPWLLAGLMAFAYYRPIVEAPSEMFEQANQALSIQQYYEFGKLPWLQTFSSHSGADFLTGFLYSYLNGFTGLSYHCYDFLVTIVYILLLYYTLKKITGNAYLAFLTVMLYPYIILLIPAYYNFIMLALLILATTLNKPSVRNYFILFSCLILMPLWRYDFGYGNIVALILSICIFMILRKELRSGIAALRKGFLLALILPVILFFIALIKNQQSILINIKDALAYLNSSQAFGIKELANERNLIYYVHFFIFPFVVALCFLFTIYKIMTSANKENKPAFVNVAVIFLSIYYFANFHRGLIRHNLAEGWDTAFSSFAFFIVTATVYDSLNTKVKVLQLAAVISFASLIIMQFKYPQPELSKNNYYSDFAACIRAPLLAPVTDVKINRAAVKTDFAKETFLDLKEFLDKNISTDATFLDFSNTPMLYFYTHRQTPNYFNQIPHTAVNDYLQERFLEVLKRYKAPVVLFSNSPEQWWDSFDGIPNTYRHYLIAEYIYMHYQPYAIINHHSVWIEKGSKLLSENHPEYQKDTVAEQIKDQPLKFLPYVMGSLSHGIINDSIQLFKKVIVSSSVIDYKNEGTFAFSEPVKNNEANYVLFKSRNLSGKREDISLGFGNNDQLNGSFSFSLKEDNEEHTYLIRLSTQYNWFSRINNNFHLSMPEGKCLVTELTLMKGKTQQ